MDVGGKVPMLSGKERLILEMLAEKGEMYGLQMVEQSRGSLPRGTVYVTLSRMEDKGYVESWQEETNPSAIGQPRRLYRPTGLGQRVRDAWELARAHVFTGFAR
jgi:DNA-binding PadR family transcriptional regulator